LDQGSWAVIHCDHGLLDRLAAFHAGPRIPGHLIAGDDAVLAKLQQLGMALCKVDEFYSSLGGIVGYQAKCLELIEESQAPVCKEDNSLAVQVITFRHA